MAKILIIDDDSLLCKTLSRMVEKLGHDYTATHTLKSGYSSLRSDVFDVVMLDVQLPDGNGLDLIPDIKKLKNSPEVIIMTGAGDPKGAELAINAGAWDYIEKPSTVNQMMLPIMRAVDYRKRQKDRAPSLLVQRENIIGSSQRITDALNQLSLAATGDVNVLITGETGTGKELFARTLHENSARAKKPFVVVDCAALPETLIESILFGHEKGAFSGADKAQAGLIKHADGGTLFLDEIGELPLSMQKTFLRVLQEHRFKAVGASVESGSDFRLVSATNRNLEKMVEEGTFRQDLLFRITAFSLELPSLRERKDDIFELVRKRVEMLCERYASEQKGFSPDFLHAVKTYSWPGNVRELFNAVTQAFTVAGPEPILYPHHLPRNIRTAAVKSGISVKKVDRIPAQTPKTDDFDSDDLLSFREYMAEGKNKLERHYIQKLLDETNGEKQKACEISGLSRPRLYGLIKKHGLS